MAKKKSLKDICQNILMVCGVITAVSGALGGVVSTIQSVMGEDEKAAPTESVATRSGGERPGGGNTIIIEQRIVGGGEGRGGGRIHKSVSVDGGGGVGEAASAEAETEARVEDVGEIVTMSAAPENGLMDNWKRWWGWMMGIGLGVVMGIIGFGWLLGRKVDGNETHQDTRGG